MAQSLCVLLRIHQQQHRLLWVLPWSVSTSKDHTTAMPNWHISRFFLLFFLTCSNAFSPGCGFRGSSTDVSVGSAVSSDVAKASTTKTFFVVLAPPSTCWIVTAHITPGLGEDTLLPSLVSTRYNSPSFTFRELVAPGIVIAGLFVQFSHHHWGRTTGAAVDHCHNLCPHLRIVRKQVLRCCQISRDVEDIEWRIASSQVLGSWSPVRCWSLGSRFLQAWRACERFFFSILFCFLGGDTICLLSSRLRPASCQ